MSVRLTTPMGRPASSITGAAPKPRSVSNSSASRIPALRWIDTGLGFIRSLARSSSKGRVGLLCGIGVFMAFSLVVVVTRSDRPNRGRHGYRGFSAREVVRIRPGHDFAKPNRKRDASRNKVLFPPKNTEKDGATPQRRVEENEKMCESAQGRQIV